MKAVWLALRTLAREWRSGELGVLLLALTVAVAALTGVGFLVGRISAAVALQASSVLAADIRLSSPRPLSDDYFAVPDEMLKKIRSALTVVGGKVVHNAGVV